MVHSSVLRAGLWHLVVNIVQFSNCCPLDEGLIGFFSKSLFSKGKNLDLAQDMIQVSIL
jgi:hypothetical protein